MRADAAFHVLEMGVDGKQINTGLWYTNSKQLERVLSMTDKTLANTHESMMEESKTQRLLRVVSIEERPYVMRKTLPNGEATAAVAPITVTAGRLEVVDFTDPFLQLGISMLMKIPDDDNKASSSFLSFLLPLSPSVWMYWAFVTVFSVLTVTTIAILSPHESARHFNATNSIWYLICILLRAGSGYNCRSISNRIVSAAWWAFTLILIAQYTANFAAVLTIDRKSLPFNSFEELGNQTEYEFGTIQGGSTMHFFMYSRLDTFRRIWLRMQNMSKSVFVYNNQQGVQKVLAEKECEGQAVETRKSLSMEKVSGIFGLLAIGLFVSFIVVIAERMVPANVLKDKKLVVK
uniref:Ionotropic glutamate receptor C-terminal domain-containing protein n=1 Tax=Panagrolaimus sp. PS1159 TaxID=55785 RepID=A0AC35FFA1_9BILA